MEDERLIDLTQMRRETTVYVNDMVVDPNLDSDMARAAGELLVRLCQVENEDKKIDLATISDDEKRRMEEEFQNQEMELKKEIHSKELELKDAQIKNEKSKWWLEIGKLVLVGVCYVGMNGAKMYLERKENCYVTDRDFDVSERKLSGLFNLFKK